MPRRTLHNGDFQRMAAKCNKYGVSELTRLEIQNMENNFPVNQNKTQLIQIYQVSRILPILIFVQVALSSQNFSRQQLCISYPSSNQELCIVLVLLASKPLIFCLLSISAISSLALRPPLVICALFSISARSSLAMQPPLWIFTLFSIQQNIYFIT